MKNLLLIAICCLGMLTAGFAQTTTASSNEITAEDVERYIDSKLDIKYRETTIKALDLTKEEIIAFDPVFAKYMDKKEALTEKKFALIDDFREEMEEDDSKKNQDEDRADFLEDYWEVEIAEMELRKDYFDILEDKIPVEKAAKFFLWEEMVEGRMKRNAILGMIPTIVQIERLPVYIEKVKTRDRSYQNVNWSVENTNHKAMCEAIDSYSVWVKNSNGRVDLSHDYTHDGLQQLVYTLTAVNAVATEKPDSFDIKKQEILSIAAKLKVDETATNHADMTRKAFINVAGLMDEMMTEDKKPVSQSKSDLMVLATKINPDVLMTEQAPHIYNFFEMANKELMSLKKNKDEMSSDYNQMKTEERGDK